MASKDPAKNPKAQGPIWRGKAPPPPQHKGGDVGSSLRHIVEYVRDYDPYLKPPGKIMMQPKAKPPRKRAR